jgi:hypothetical protein
MDYHLLPFTSPGTVIRRGCLQVSIPGLTDLPARKKKVAFTESFEYPFVRTPWKVSHDCGEKFELQPA